MINAKILHIWKIPLIIADSKSNLLFATLSHEEKEAVKRLHFEKHRRRYIAAHAALREILANELQIPSHTLEISKGSNGKPYIDGNPLYFNLTHSEEIALIAIMIEGPVGIDVEFSVKEVDELGIAKRFLHQFEFEQLTNAPKKERRKLFYHCWTGKEAFLKAKGVGITHHMKAFSLDFHNKKSMSVITADKELEDFQDWHAHTYEPEENYIATIVSLVRSEKMIFHDYRFQKNTQ